MIAVIMCGGMGTRMRPITEVLPKPLLPVGGRPVLDILLEQLQKTGVETVYITLGYKADVIIDWIETQNYSFDINLVNSWFYYFVRWFVLV